MQLIEPDKCDEWIWASYDQMREIETMQTGSLFLPIRNLMIQRPAICAAMKSGDNPGA